MDISNSARLINIAAAAMLGIGFLFGAGNGVAHASARSEVVARVSLSQQTMEVIVDGRTTFEWKVSTGRKGYGTPTGSWSAKWVSRNHRSRKYNNAPMPFAVFFKGGYAVHATYETKRLGRPASHGCVRLHPEAAADFFQLVRTFGAGNTQIEIVR